MEKKWIKTEQMLEYSSKRKKIGDSTNWFDYTWYTESEFLEIHAGEWWMREI